MSELEGKTVLLVDDEATLLRYIRTILESLKFKILEAESGAKALEILAGYASEIHLLLTDIRMAPINGLELAERVRSQRPRVKILFISGFAESSGLVSSEIERGNSAFLRKPFTPSDLRGNLIALLSGN